MSNQGWIALVLLAACGPTHQRTSGNNVAADAPIAVVADAPVVQPIPDGPTQVASGPVSVVITADNAYSFGYGDVDGISNFTQGQRATTAAQIFSCPLGVGPEAYTVPAASAPDGAYLYIVAWDDLEVTQGVIGQFSRDTGTVYTGDSRFEVCATGLDYSTGPNATTGPTLDVINAQIAQCNTGTGSPTTTSMGWVNSTGATTSGAVGKLAIGEANDDNAGTFQLVCQPTGTTQGVSAAAQWMWYDPQDGQPGDAFHATGVNRFKAFLIFRLGAGSIIE